MKFIVSSQVLLKHLQVVSGVLGSGSTALPILENFLFEIADGKLTVSASDLETTMTTSLEVTSKEDANIAVPARILLDSLKSFPETPLTFTVNKETFGIEISSEYGNYRMAGLNADEYPRPARMEAAASCTLPSHLIARGIAKTIFATGNDEMRPVMSGVFFEFHEEKAIFVATDAHKLVRYTRTDAKCASPASFIMPKKPLNQLKNLLGSEDADVTVEYNETNARFTWNEVTLVCRLIDGRYPNYEAVIPKENPNALTINRQAFLNSIKRVSLFSNKTTHQIRLRLAGNELNVSAEDPDFANEANERLSCTYKGDDMSIGFNSRFLMEMLANLDTDEVILEMSQPNRAGILLPSESAIDDEQVTMLVMPVMLNN